MNTKDILKSGVAVLAIAWSLSGTSWATDREVTVGTTPPTESNGKNVTIPPEEINLMLMMIQKYESEQICKDPQATQGCTTDKTYSTTGSFAATASPNIEECFRDAVRRNAITASGNSYQFSCESSYSVTIAKPTKTNTQ